MSDWNIFLENIKRAEEDLGKPAEIWYRGQLDSGWQLIPSLVRVSDWEEKEKRLFDEFRRLSVGLFEPRDNDWHILFDMQHYGIPTRLLDWTLVLGVAVAFVLYTDYKDDRDSAIYVLNPLALNRSSRRGEIISIPEDKDFEYKKIYWENRPAQLEKPLAIQPNYITDRLKAQAGRFTVYGSTNGNFENLTDDCFKKIILPATAKAEARQFLKWANLNDFTLDFLHKSFFTQF